MQNMTDLPDIVRYLLLLPDGLGLRNVKALRLTCKGWEAAIPHLPSGFYRNRVIALLESWNIDANLLCGTLASCQGMAVLAGSFTLRAILGDDEKWEPGDVDLFCCGDGSKERLVDSIRNCTGQNVYVDYNEHDSYEGIMPNFTRQKWYTNTRGHAIDIIDHTDFDTFEELWERIGDFDLPFCGLLFDGRTIRVPKPSVWESVLTKTAEVESDVDPIRKERYVQRGFEIAVVDLSHVHARKRSSLDE